MSAVAVTSNSRHLLALECNAYEARGHLLYERGGGHGELEEEDGLGTRVELDGEGDVATAVTEECSGDFPAYGRGYGEV